MTDDASRVHRVMTTAKLLERIDARLARIILLLEERREPDAWRAEPISSVQRFRLQSRGYAPQDRPTSKGEAQDLLDALEAETAVQRPLGEG